MALLAMAMPVAVWAGVVTAATAVPSNTVISATGVTYTIGFTTATVIPAATGTVTITFPATTSLATVVPGNVSGLATGVAVIDNTAKTVVITLGATAADPGVKQIVVATNVVNPSVVGSNSITIVTSTDTVATATFTLYSAVSAGATILTANTASTITVSAPAAVSGWSLTNVGLNTRTPTSDPERLQVTSNALWTVNVKDAMANYGTTAKLAGSAGKLVEATGTDWVTASPKSLANALVIDASGAGGNAAVTLSGADQAIYSGAAAFDGYKSVLFKQTTTIADVVLTSPNVYRIVVTFTSTTS